MLKLSSGLKKLLLSLLSLGLILAIDPVLAEEGGKLPKAPQRGTPEGSSKAGGTRTQPQLDRICSPNHQAIAYLLDNEIRDYTLATHPTFWFYIPQHNEQFTSAEFMVTESQTEKTIYRTKVELNQPEGIIGITLPQEEQYTLEPNQDYSWNLQINCRQQEKLSNMVLTGWVRRLPMTSSLENSLAASSKKYQVYMQNNIFYDALTNLIQLRQQNPTDREIEQDWIEFLGDLGKQNLSQKPLR